MNNGLINRAYNYLFAPTETKQVTNYDNAFKGLANSVGRDRAINMIGNSSQYVKNAFSPVAKVSFVPSNLTNNSLGQYTLGNFLSNQNKSVVPNKFGLDGNTFSDMKLNSTLANNTNNVTNGGLFSKFGDFMSSGTGQGLAQAGSSLMSVLGAGLAINDALQQRKMYKSQLESLALQREVARENLAMQRAEYARLKNQRAGLTSAYSG